MGAKLCFFLPRKEHRTKAFLNVIFRTITEPQRKDISGGWGKLHGKELHIFYSSTNTIRVTTSLRMAGGENYATFKRERRDS